MGTLQPPGRVKAVLRLQLDLEVIRMPTVAEDPPHCAGCEPRAKSTFCIVMGTLLAVVLVGVLILDKEQRPTIDS
jgi:hypothetical protein